MSNQSPKRIRQELKAMRLDTDTIQKEFILEVLQNEENKEKTRASAMKTAQELGLKEALPIAKNIITSDYEYTGLKQAAVKAIGVLGTQEADLNLLKKLHSGLPSASRGSGYAESLKKTLEAAITNLSKTVEQQPSVPPSDRSDVAPCCPPELQMKWKKSLAQGGVNGMKPVFDKMQEQVSSCKEPDKLNDLISIQFFHSTYIEQHRKRLIKDDDFYVLMNQLLDRTLSFIDHCGPSDAKSKAV